MPKILSQAGISLADIYNVEGSIAGIETLETQTLPIVHEVGSTIWSERFSTTIRRGASAAIAQNLTFDVVLTDFPEGIWRILGAAVFVGAAARAGQAMLALRDPGSDREMPFFTWQSTNDRENQIRIQDDGAAIGNSFQLMGTPLQMPVITAGTGQRQTVPDIAFRGQSLGFGAGTVTFVAVILIGFTHVGGISSVGLPVPSW